MRKLTRRIGPETVSEMTRALIVNATREKRFRPRAVRIDSTVIEADIKHPTDAGLACRMTHATRGADETPDETPAFRARQGWRDTRDRFCVALEGLQGRERWPRPPPDSWLP